MRSQIILNKFVEYFYYKFYLYIFDILIFYMFNDRDMHGCMYVGTYVKVKNFIWENYFEFENFSGI